MSNTAAAGTVLYINYTTDPLNNVSLREEWYDDPFGWRTGTAGRTQYYETTPSWQHWLSPQIEFRPELSYWRSIATPALDGYSTRGIVPNKRDTGLFAADVIFHF